ncbi:hypothetical protein HI113_03790 [Corallococcus exiguus]|uniref:hypothetical protein n=1 Tax=Corallococcus exiguus TaxID=83462 RepID=UPI001474D873|nr:hypothetical protein [Corallococcus exiguus]NNB93033.1 hypothetical protein [Corallococcus exiguus]
MRFGVASLKSFRTGKSISEPELQAADFLATALKGLSPLAQESQPDCPHMKRVAEALLPLLMIYESGKLLGSSKFIGALVRPLAAWMREKLDSPESTA